MAISCVLGIDIGTTTIKAVLFDREGTDLRTAQQEYPTYYPQRSWAEQDPEDWWHVLAGLLRQLLSDGSYDVRAIGVSSQAPSLVPIDERGQALGRALIWMDRRAEAEAAELLAAIGEVKLADYSFNRADPFYTAAKLLWFKRHQPEHYARTSAILQANGYINMRLTSHIGMDAAHASITQLFDVRSGKWAADVVSKLGLSTELLPDVYPCAAVIGVVTAEAAVMTGLPTGTPVVAGTVDGAAAALEAGVLEPGQAAEMCGTSSVLVTSIRRPRYEPAFIAMEHAIPQQSLLLAAMSTTGASLRWMRDQLYSPHSAAAGYDALNEAAEAADERSDLLFLPYMMGERSPIWDTDARGMFFGLSLNTNAGDMVRAIMEGAAMALRHNIEIMEQAGDRIQTLRLLGGPANSAVWNQIKADVLGRELEILGASGGAPLGAAILAGAAVGFFPDLQQGLQQTNRRQQIVAPSEGMEAFYSSKFAIYKQLYIQNAASFKKLSQLFKGDTR